MPTILLDPTHQADLAERLHQQHVPRHGRFVVSVTPSSNAAQLATDVLVALGKRPHLATIPRSERLWDLVEIWLVAERARQVIVTDPAVGAAQGLTQLLLILQETEIDVYLVCPKTPITPRALEAIGPANVGTVDELNLQQPPPKTATPGLPSLRQLGEEHFTTFRDSVSQRLTPAAADAFQQLWERTDLAFGRLLPSRRVNAQHKVEAALAVAFASIPNGAVGVVLLRVAQVRLFLDRWLLEDTAERPARAAAAALTQYARGTTVLADSRAHVYPTIAAALTLRSHVHREQADQMSRLTVDDVAEDGSTVALKDRTLTINETGQAAIRAARADAVAHDTAFILTDSHSERLTPRAINRIADRHELPASYRAERGWVNDRGFELYRIRYVA